MTQLQYYDGGQSQGASYLEIAEFISNCCGAQTEADLAQLWRRIVFPMAAVSYTEDHLRNHHHHHWFLELQQRMVWKAAHLLAHDLMTRWWVSHGLHLDIADARQRRRDHQLAFDVKISSTGTQTQSYARFYDEVLIAVIAVPKQLKDQPS